MDIGADTVRVLRGDALETEHRVAWAVAGPASLASGPAAAALPVFARSATKPFQALPAVRAGALGALGLDDRHLAVACASHGGGPEHRRLVAQILAAAGLDERRLGCGPLPPLDPAVALAGATPSRIANNCSGKHALGLATCVVRDWPLDGYRAADHPLQAAMRAEVERGCGGEPAGEAVDGCGMRTYRVGLGALAAAFGRLAAGAQDDALGRVRRAMRAHPDLVAFPGAVDAELMRAEEGVVAKVGASGVLAVGLPDGRGLALKVLDGAKLAATAAGVALCRSVLGLAAAGPALDALAAPVLRNTRDEPVGSVEVVLAGGSRHLAAVR